MTRDASAAAPISVPTAIILGLVASFVQSLGLTIQRKSHLQNEALPTFRRRTEWKRPLWLIGFAIFLCANIGGTVFQIGALPIVMLAPLGAVSLLYNALLARYLLNDFLSTYMITGTALIATGAVLIGYFGVVPSPPHDLDELLDLYGRPTFVAFATIFVFLFIGVLAISHLAEWQLHARLSRSSSPPPKTKTRRKSSRSRLRRRWSAPSLAPVAEVSESSSGIATPVLAIADEMARRSAVFDPDAAASIDQAGPSPGTTIASMPVARGGRRDYGTIVRGQPSSASRDGARRRSRQSSEVPRLEHRDSHEPIDAESVKRTKLMLSVAYGGASGTMSGACLLLAKSGVELLMLSFAGQNQFVRWQSWMLITILLGAALLQLWYLNKALKMADPTLVCPLAFCFYNTSSIALGLVYFDQLGALAWYDILAVAIGISVLLSGVWIVSLHGSDSDGPGSDETASLLTSPSMSESAPMESTEQAEGLLANAAGIAGPHLPLTVPLSGDSSSILPIDTHLSSPEALSSNPIPPSPSSIQSRHPSTEPSAPRKSTSQPRKRRGSSSNRRPTITLDFPIDGSLLLQSPVPQDDVERNVDAPFNEDGSPRSSARYRTALYNAIIEHGLSIGLSPSSPGFHLQPRSPSASRFPTSHSGPLTSSKRPGGQVRRTLSETDAGYIQPAAVLDRPNVQVEAVPGQDDSDPSAASSGFAVLPDQGVLRRRLEQLKKSSRRWLSLGGFFDGSHGGGGGGRGQEADRSPSLSSAPSQSGPASRAEGSAVTGLGLLHHDGDESRPLLPASRP